MRESVSRTMYVAGRHCKLVRVANFFFVITVDFLFASSHFKISSDLVLNKCKKRCLYEKCSDNCTSNNYRKS